MLLPVASERLYARLVKVVDRVSGQGGGRGGLAGSLLPVVKDAPCALRIGRGKGQAQAAVLAGADLIRQFDEAGIEADGDFVTIGSMCTFQQLTESDKVPEYLKEAARFMASRTKRNMATIGGNIAAMRTDSYLLPVLFAVCARVDVLTAEGKQNICINSFMEAAQAGEEMLITAVIVPEKIKVVSKRYANTAQSHAVLTMSSAITEKGFTLAGAVKNCGIFRFRTFEDMIRKDPDISEADALAFFKEADSLKISDDMFGSEEYKRYLMGVTAYDFCRKLVGKEV